MLSMRINLADVAAGLSRAGKSVSFGGSHVEAFASSQICQSAHDDGDSKAIWVGEHDDPFPAAEGMSPGLDAYRELRGFEGVKLLLHRAGGVPVLELARTADGGCPIYVAAAGDALVASWKFEEAVQALPDPQPDIDACRLFLAQGASLTRPQIVRGVSMLWPGESLTFRDGGIEFREIDTPDVVVSAALAESARVTDEFVRLTAEAVRGNLAKASQPLVELSGGLDSSCVAVAAAAIGKRLNSYSCIHDGAIGIQQSRRRRELVELLGLNDFEFPASSCGPFASLEVDECRRTVFDDMYRLPCVHAVEAHPAQGIDLVITGIGGDELTGEHSFIRQEWELAGTICSSSLTAALGRADMFMRRGIWPVHPFLRHDVVDFCRAIPNKMRQGRRLNQLTLARAGVSDGFLFPRYYEHWGHMARREAVLTDFDEALAESIVADYGIADVSGPLFRAREATLGGFTPEIVTEMYLLLKLEAVLRSCIG